MVELLIFIGGTTLGTITTLVAYYLGASSVNRTITKLTEPIPNTNNTIEEEESLLDWDRYDNALKGNNEEPN
jgi:hypothetical protein|tara:strand:+ start:245 stop:460 length:216 start_codon:yes stop_codon:yes gene_type:complete